VIDAGANTGFYSLLAASMGAEVVAVEPSEEVLPLLERNLEINGFSCRVLKCAVGDVSRETRFYVRNDKTMGSIVYETDQYVTVPVVRLDDVIPLDGKTDLIKIDVEGHEYPVLRGAEALIANSRPRIIFECLTDEAASELEAFMRAHRYAIAAIDNAGSLTRMGKIDLFAGNNFAAIP
jgi:FkbM family methyltransferase